MKSARALWILAFLAYPITIYAAFVIGPLAYSFFFSFTNWNGISYDYDFVGLGNFAKIASDPLFSNALFNSLIWTVFAVFVPTGLGLLLALMLNTKISGREFYKAMFFLPICLAPVVVGQIWIWIYQPQWGLLNTVLDAGGLDGIKRAWLADKDAALYSVMFAWGWQQTGLAMVIFLSGLATVPEEVLEASLMDGANKLQQILFVVIPLLKPSTIVVVALMVINSLKGFEIIYIMTGGGPFHSSDTLAVFMYTEAFRKYNMGYGSAISVVLFLIILVVIIVYFRQLKKLDQLYN